MTKTPASGTGSPGFDRWTPELRRAVMAARPTLFASPADRQWRYRVTLPDADRELIVAALLREHGKRRPAALAKLEAQGRRVPLGLHKRINGWLQPLVGIGKDAFSLNGHFTEGKSILEFTRRSPSAAADDIERHRNTDLPRAVKLED